MKACHLLCAPPSPPDAELEHSHILGNLKNLARVFQHMREWM